MSLGENIYRLRTERNLSQEELADALGISRQSVSKWENDSAVPELEKLLKLSEIFDITLDELVGRDAQQEPEPPQPEPEPERREPPVHTVTPTRIYAGIVLLFCALLSLILFLLFNAAEFILFVSTPLGIGSALCLIPNKWLRKAILVGLVTFVGCLIAFYLLVYMANVAAEVVTTTEEAYPSQIVTPVESIE